MAVSLPSSAHKPPHCEQPSNWMPGERGNSNANSATWQTGHFFSACRSVGGVCAAKCASSAVICAICVFATAFNSPRSNQTPPQFSHPSTRISPTSVSVRAFPQFGQLRIVIHPFSALFHRNASFVPASRHCLRGPHPCSKKRSLPQVEAGSSAIPPMRCSYYGHDVPPHTLSCACLHSTGSFTHCQPGGGVRVRSVSGEL